MDALEESREGGRALHVGGFVLVDPFEVVLRELSESYLAYAWGKLQPALRGYGVDPPDLSWGHLYPSQGFLPDTGRWSPADFIGWIGRHLVDLQESGVGQAISAAVGSEVPRLASAVTWRSRKWRIAPDDYGSALHLIEAVCTDEVSDWDPRRLVQQESLELSSPWRQVAAAILTSDQQRLDAAMAEAASRYTPVGYRIVVRGFAAYLAAAEETRVQIGTGNF